MVRFGGYLVGLDVVTHRDLDGLGACLHRHHGIGSVTVIMEESRDTRQADQRLRLCFFLLQFPPTVRRRLCIAAVGLCGEGAQIDGFGGVGQSL